MYLSRWTGFTKLGLAVVASVFRCLKYLAQSQIMGVFVSASPVMAGHVYTLNTYPSDAGERSRLEKQKGE